MTRIPHPLQPRPQVLWTFVLLGVASLSFASIFVKLADAPPLAIAVYRVSIASLIIAPYFLAKSKLPPSIRSVRTIFPAVLSGIFLALHFTFWITSLQMTSVASATTFVNTTPLFTALLSWLFLRERLGKRVVAGLLTAMSGSIFLAGTDYAFSGEALLGDLLALSGALMATGYLMAGQILRRSLDLATYTLAVYGTAALFLLACCFFAGTPLNGFSPKTYLFLVLLAVVPQLIGHSTFNWSLKYLSPSIVAVLILGEPIGAILLAWLFLGESISPLKAGGLMILGTGILMSSLAAGLRQAASPASPHPDR